MGSAAEQRALIVASEGAMMFETWLEEHGVCYGDADQSARENVA